MFDNCGDVEDLPVKSIKGTIRNSTNYNELPAAATGKRRHQATIHHDNAVIFIDDTDEEDDEKFVAKKPRVVSYGSTMSKDTQRHVQYSSPPLSKNISIIGLHHALLMAKSAGVSLNWCSFGIDCSVRLL